MGVEGVCRRGKGIVCMCVACLFKVASNRMTGNTKSSNAYNAKYQD